tara:strand:+ start:687 stop:1418 length:732 start_codon:yes stop_codon:yes gene_type:complete
MAIYVYPELATPSFELEVAKGAIAGHSSIHKFGANFDVDTNSDPESVWTYGGLYPWDSLVSPQIIYLKSSNSGDTSTVRVQGLDENWNEVSEIISITGVTVVSTTTTFRRVFRMVYDTGASNVGAITAHVTNGTGVVVAHIPATYGQTLMAIYTIPAGFTGYMLNLDATLNKGEDGNLNLYRREFGTSFNIAHMAEIYQNTYRYDFSVPLVFTEKSDIDFRLAEVETSNTRVTSNFDMILIEN